jgi:hypothetical protein
MAPMEHLLPISIKGVLIENEAVMLLENERDEWELPGGRLERDSVFRRGWQRREDHGAREHPIRQISLSPGKGLNTE